MVTGLVFQKYLLAMKRKVILIALCVVVVFFIYSPKDNYIKIFNFA